MSKLKRGIAASLLLSLLTYGCAGGKDSPTEKDKKARDRARKAAPEIVLSDYTGEQCLDVEGLFSFLQQNRDVLAIQSSSVDFDYDSNYRVRRNFILSLAAGEFVHTQDPSRLLMEFENLSQADCENLSVVNSLAETEPVNITAASANLLEFERSLNENAINYKVEVLDDRSFKIQYKYEVTDFFCQAPTEVEVTREQIIRVAPIVEDLPKSEMVASDFLNLLLDAHSEPLPEIRRLANSGKEFVEIDRQQYQNLMNSTPHPQINTCNDIPVGGLNPAPPEEPEPVPPSPPGSEAPDSGEEQPEGEEPEVGTPPEGDLPEAPLPEPPEEDESENDEVDGEADGDEEADAEGDGEAEGDDNEE